MFKNFWANPKTSIAGILTLGCLAAEIFHWLPSGTISAAATLFAGLGLISAADQATINNLKQ